MHANYIYDIFETTRKNDAPDLTIGLAMLKAEKPLPEGMTDEGVRQFMSRHQKLLTAAYKSDDREIFAMVVAACEGKDAGAGEGAAAE